MGHHSWAIVTGEYPPDRGGVSDYTRAVSCGLAAAGDDVHVLAPQCGGGAEVDAGVTVHRLPGGFNSTGRGAATRILDSTKSHNQRLLVQYVPQAFGWKAMNVPFCRWLVDRPEQLWLMFHEVAVPYSWTQSAGRNVQAAVTRHMASLVGRAAQRTFVSIPAWATTLGAIVGLTSPIEWLPIPSLIDTRAAPERVALLRHSLTTDERSVVVGHFGVGHPGSSPIIVNVLPAILKADRRRVGLLVGRNSERTAAEMVRKHPVLVDRIVAVGGVGAADAAAYLSTCDVLVQPYPDGVSCRRTTVMAGLALGRAIVTNTGPLTEALWESSGAVAISSGPSAIGTIAQAESLLADPDRRRDLEDRARALYSERFAIQHTIACLRQ